MPESATEAAFAPEPIPAHWRVVPGFDHLSDVTYHQHETMGVVRLAFNRPDSRNSFRPQTVDELHRCLTHAQAQTDVGVVLLTGNGPSGKDGGWAFSSGGDQRVRGKAGYEYEADQQDSSTASAVGRLHILEVQRLIRFMPKVVISLVSGWAAGGGHSLNVICDLSIACRQHAMFKQTDAAVGSFDAGYGSGYLARVVGQKRAREIFFLGQQYDAQRAYEIGLVNAVVNHDELEATSLQWAREILSKSPTSIRMLKYAMNAVDDGMVGMQLFAGEATRLAYGTPEALEGRDSFLQRRSPDWAHFPWHY